MDPAAAGGAPPDIAALVSQMVQQEMAKAGMGAGMGGAPGAPGAGGKLKIDPAFLYMEVARVRKLLTHIIQKTGLGMPEDILDDGVVAQATMGQQPASAPLGQEGAPAGPEGGMPGLPGIGQSGPISPIEPPKTAEDMLRPGIPVADSAQSGVRIDGPVTTETFNQLGNGLAALAALSRSLNG